MGSQRCIDFISNCYSSESGHSQGAYVKQPLLADALSVYAPAEEDVPDVVVLRIPREDDRVPVNVWSSWHFECCWLGPNLIYKGFADHKWDA